LRFFSFSDRRWYSVSNSPALDPNLWDIRGNLLAFQTYGEASSRQIVRVTTLPDCSPIREFQLPQTDYKYADGGELAISPDGKKLAVLVPVHEIQAPLSGSSYRVPGRSCVVVVYDLATGERTDCPRRALHTLCWMPDSARLLFHSLADQNLLGTEKLPKGWRKQYDFDNPEKNPFARPPVFSYLPTTGQVTAAPDFTEQLVTAQAQQIILSSNASLIVLNLTNGTRRHLRLSELSQFTAPVVSPDNRFAVMRFRLNPFTSYLGYPTIVDLENPSQRYYLGQLFYRLEWTAP
jgi:hypothetical protein